MLLEYALYAITPCAPAVRKLGYVHEAVSIWSRYRRCKSAWHEHIDHSKQAIERAVERCGSFNTAVILGSGMLYDIPIALLSERFERVLLVDIVHLWPARFKARNLPNVTFVQEDVTGLADALITNPAGTIASPEPPAFASHLQGVDLVVSANLLSQLPLLPAAWLRSHPLCGDAFTEADIETFCQTLMRQHLEALQALTCNTLLLCDNSALTTYSDGRPAERTALLHGVEALLPAPQSEWQWKLAPEGELGPNARCTHSVNAYTIAPAI